MDWSSVPAGPEDAVFKVSRLFNECKNPDKVSLGVGAYRDNNGKPLVLEAVIKAKEQIGKLEPQSWIHEYQSIQGNPDFLAASQELVFGKEICSMLGNRLVSLQSLSGTGACSLGFTFLQKFAPKSKILYLPDPTWGNHFGIAKHAGLEIRTYRYLDLSKPTTPMLDLQGMLEDLKQAPEGSTVVLHMCAHNPTGVDPTLSQLEEIAEVVKERNLIPFFDNAYQGFASGDLEGDAASLRMFVSKGLNPLVACSFAKNMGLYGERIGALHVVTSDQTSAAATSSQFKIIARVVYSSPPRFGAMVAHRVMTDSTLRILWENELKEMSGRINKMRSELRRLLEQKLPGTSWKHVTDQIGMFSYTGLTKDQVEHCANPGAVFMLPTGRISMAGLNDGNLEHTAKAFAGAIKACPV
eukprot:CAMPEP_0197823886 /NCGR_PEP_ID=MMETSP1437-20131217/1200_1 /TAXON_ID=49252 ORGANISM="Eucampia antarctica, Strain CCMP1452" /NCGR_SAMPLE_ID=MMETSP1437 /ASSEMBLY_ACC=CAM_ASM_001096 /LENGTH=410 /DNA_ID=CAMNT_0043423273 /DNA_START=17 /DNA_END=1249 /DNA_ORIENTATION=-